MTGEILPVALSFLLVVLAVYALLTERRATRVSQAYRSALQSIEQYQSTCDFMGRRLQELEDQRGEWVGARFTVSNLEIVQALSDQPVKARVRVALARQIARELVDRLHVVRAITHVPGAMVFETRIWVNGLVPPVEGRVVEAATAALANAAKR